MTSAIRFAALAVLSPLLFTHQPTPSPARVTSIGSLSGVRLSSLAVSPNGKLFYMAAGDTAVVVYNRDSRATSVVARGAYSYVVNSPSGRRLAMLRRQEGRSQEQMIWTIPVDPLSGKPVGVPVRISATPASRIAFAPDERQIAFLADGNSSRTKIENRIVVAPTIGGVERTILSLPATELKLDSSSRQPSLVSITVPTTGLTFGNFRWSGDGKWIYSQRDQNLIRVSVATGEVQAIVPDRQVSLGTPGYSPDDQRIVVSTNTVSRTSRTYEVLDLAHRSMGSTTATLPSQGEILDFSWMNNGLHLAMAVWVAAEQMHVYDIGRASDSALPVTGATVPAISHDGALIAAHVTDSGAPRIMVMNIDGSAQRILKATAPIVDRRFPPCWSPDGKYIAYRSARGQTLNVVDVASGKVTELAHADFTLSEYRWRSNSQSLVYAKDDGTMEKANTSVREVTLAGSDKLIRELTALMPPASTRLKFAGDDNLISIRYGLLLPIARGNARQLYAAPDEGDPVGRWPSVTTDGAWVAKVTKDRRTVEVLATDGRAKVSVMLPSAFDESDMLEMTPDRQSIFFTRSAIGDTHASLHRMPIGGGASRQIATLAKGQAFTDLRISQDGRKIVYTVSSPSTVLFDIDIGSGVSPSRSGRIER